MNTAAAQEQDQPGEKISMHGYTGWCGSTDQQKNSCYVLLFFLVNSSYVLLVLVKDIIF